MLEDVDWWLTFPSVLTRSPTGPQNVMVPTFAQQMWGCTWAISLQQLRETSSRSGRNNVAPGASPVTRAGTSVPAHNFR